MFPTDSNNSCNSFTVPFSDQTFLFSKLLEGFGTDDKNPNPFPPFSPFSIFDQFNTHLCFLPPDHDQPPELQNSPWEHHHEELKLPVVSAGQDLITATSTCSTGGNGGTENFHGNGFAGDPANGSSSSAVGRAKHDVVRKNRSLSKKDRHSKINTAQGPRDRRMRLSLDIAQRFFGLQDMLGFDKASKTVDWLLCKSQSEISRVSRSRRSDVISASDSFAASECCNEVSEVVSKDDVSRAVEIDKVSKKTGSKEKKSGKAASSVSSSRRDGFNNFSKESREKARARARERTKERKPAELLNPQSHHSYGDHQGHTISDHHETLENISYWNPSSTIFNHRQNNGASQQMQFGDIQSYARPW